LIPLPTTSTTIVDDLDRQGWSVTPGFVEVSDALDLGRESRAAWDEGAFRRARVGRGGSLAMREDIRRDHVMWLREGETTATQRLYLDRIEALRLEINARFFLGLFDFEGHFAVYPAGAFYKPHLDRHHETRDRLVTVILYLNPDWQPGDGGELKIWTTPGATDGPFEVVEPRLGTLVAFFAGDHWHEVLPAAKTRLSITGWFRARGA